MGAVRWKQHISILRTSDTERKSTKDPGDWMWVWEEELAAGTQCCQASWPCLWGRLPARGVSVQQGLTLS